MSDEKVVLVDGVKMKVNERGLVAVKVLRPYDRFFAGDVCGVEPAEAARIVTPKKGRPPQAELVDPPARLSRAEESTTADKGDGKADAKGGEGARGRRGGEAAG